MKKMLFMGLVLATLLSTVATVWANPSPGVPGSPGVPATPGGGTDGCGNGNAEISPRGFSTQGFAHAGVVYAGSPGSASALHANSVRAVSQYNVACFQMTSHNLSVN